MTLWVLIGSRVPRLPPNPLDPKRQLAATAGASSWRRQQERAAGGGTHDAAAVRVHDEVRRALLLPLGLQPGRRGGQSTAGRRCLVLMAALATRAPSRADAAMPHLVPTEHFATAWRSC